MASSSHQFAVSRTDRPVSEKQDTQVRVTDPENTVCIPADSTEAVSSCAANNVDELQEANSSTLTKNRDLELAKRLSAMNFQDQDMRPSVPTNSSDLALQAEVVQLRQENADLRRDNAAKDEVMSDLPALLENCQAQLTAIEQGFSALNKSYHETTVDLSRVVQDIDIKLKARTAFKKLQSWPSSATAGTAAEPPQASSSASKSEKSTADTAAAPPQSSSSASRSEKDKTDTAAGPPQSPPSASKKNKAETAAAPSQPPQSASEKNKADTVAGPPQPSSSASKSEKDTADTAAGPPQPSRSALEPEEVATNTGSVSKASSKPDYAQALKSPAEKRRILPKAKVPLEQHPVFAYQFVKRETADRTLSEPEKWQISQNPNKAPTRGGSTQGKDAGGHGVTKSQGNPTADQGSKSTQMTVPGSLEQHIEPRGTNVTAGSDQPTKNPEVKSSVTTPAAHAGGNTVTDKDKNSSSNASPAPTARRRRKKDMTDSQVAYFKKWGFEIPSEDDTDDEQESESKAVASPVPATPQSPAPKVAEDGPQSLPSITHAHSGVGLSGAAIGDIKPAQSCQIQPAIPLGMIKPDRSVQPPENNSSSITKSSAAQTSQEPSSNVRKRMADEGQLGMSASSKRLRSS